MVVKLLLYAGLELSDIWQTFEFIEYKTLNSSPLPDRSLTAK